MPETVDLSCPNGCFELDVSGEHACRDDREFLEDVAIADGPAECPECGATFLPQETHLDEDSGLWIPPGLREVDGQVVIRTPKGTIQHFGSQSLDGYYGMVDESAFGDPDDFIDCRNPELAPNQVSIKPQGEDAIELEVDLSGGDDQ